jgi:hypothetical protein
MEPFGLAGGVALLSFAIPAFFVDLLRLPRDNWLIKRWEEQLADCDSRCLLSPSVRQLVRLERASRRKGHTIGKSHATG